MFYSKSIAALLAAAASLAYAAPVNSTDKATPTTNTVTPALPVSSSVVTHRVAVGLGGLRFEPNNIVAEIGDIVEFKFLARNHSVAQSSFAEPCKPILDAATGAQKSFFAGFDFFVDQPGVLAPNVYQITVTDKKPIWFYCPQTTGNHCQNGMAGVINQNFNSDFTLARYLANAATTGVSVVPPYIQGGLEGPNPNPNAGFP
jgi:plastocyanin